MLRVFLDVIWRAILSYLVHFHDQLPSETHGVSACYSSMMLASRLGFKGLFVRGHIIADGPRGRTALALAKRGSVDGLSIGFRTQQAQPNGRGRDLNEIDLWEVSIVTFPMLPEARFRVAEALLPA